LKRRDDKSARLGAATRQQWRGLPSVRISNDVVEMVALDGGGHIAEFHFLKTSGKPHANVLWECPWDGAAPKSSKARQLAAKYGPKGVGEFLASFTGHALCLDYFGAASPEETLQGLPLHGEAACTKWTLLKSVRHSFAMDAKWQVELPSAGLSFYREIHLSRNESVAFFKESMTNHRAADHYFHWVQHVTLGSPLLDPASSRLFVSGSRATTWPLGYEKKNLLSSNREFHWPRAPREKGGVADVSIPFQERGTGFVASVLLDPSRERHFVASLNWHLGLVSGYFFRGRDFPWVAVWEENCARKYVPWNGRTQARGMEFGTTPMPIGKEATFRSGSLFDAPCWARIPARGMQTACYAAFLAEVPKSWRGIRDVRAEKDDLVIKGSGAREVVRIPARGVSKWTE
jgi:hypothetical protein